MQFVGFVGLSVYLAATGKWGPLADPMPWQPWAWAFLAALLNTLSSLALYRAFQTGVLALVAPIAASYPTLTVVLAFLSGERVSRTRGAGIGAALIGVLLAASPFLPAAHAKTAGPARRRWSAS